MEVCYPLEMNSDASESLLLRSNIADQGDQMAVLNAIRLRSDPRILPDAGRR
jgi:hypothetical protein